MWEAVREELQAGHVIRLVLQRDGQALPLGQVLEHWRQDADFRGFFNNLLAEAPFAAYFWELPPITRANSDRPFECILADSPALAAVRPDPAAFAERFAAADASAQVTGFPNLGGDAWLVAPCPRGPSAAYAHLAAFVRHAPQAQRHALWRRLGAAIAERIRARPLWVSTSGLGVYWLHVRLDTYPKYYTYRPYIHPPGVRPAAD
jgi:hypothetical protein